MPYLPHFTGSNCLCTFVPMKGELNDVQKKEWAKMLYTRIGAGNDEIVATVDIAEEVLQAWIDQEKWDGIRRTLPAAREEQLAVLYEALGKISADLKGSKEPDVKSVDVMLKYTTAIKNLEAQQPTLGDVTEVAKRFITWLRAVDVDDARKTGLLFDQYIQQL